MGHSQDNVVSNILQLVCHCHYTALLKHATALGLYSQAENLVVAVR